MSDGEVRKVSRRDIQLVQNLIERCLQLYMNQKEVVETLELNARIEPGFTELVWQKLEEENREFFKAYHVRLMLKNQIIVFNDLLQKQVDVMERLSLNSNRPIIPKIPPELQHVPSSLTAAQTPIYSNPEFGLCTDGGFSDCHVVVGEEPLEGFGGGGEFNEPLAEIDPAHFGILGRIPRNFSFSDLTEDFTQSTDILENYGRSPFLGPESVLSSSAGRGFLGERK